MFIRFYPWLKSFCLVSSLSFFVFPLVLPDPSFAREVTLTLLFTNDHHGQVDPIHQDDPQSPWAASPDEWL